MRPKKRAPPANTTAPAAVDMQQLVSAAAVLILTIVLALVFRRLRRGARGTPSLSCPMANGDAQQPTAMRIPIQYSARRKRDGIDVPLTKPAATQNDTPTWPCSAVASKPTAHATATSDPAATTTSPLVPRVPTVLPLSSVVSPPSTADDERVPVRDLLAAHAARLAELRQLVAVDSLYDARRHDDLWLLRYLLSHNKGKGSVAAAAKAARGTLRWRAEHRMDELACELETTPAIAHPNVTRQHRYHVKPHGIRFLLPDPMRGPILLGSMVDFDYGTAHGAAGGPSHAAAARHTRVRRALPVARAEETMRRPVEEYAASMRTMQEWFFMQCDRVTRQTGRLTKSARFIQVHGLSFRALNREWLKMDAAIAKEMEDFYPQALGMIICLDPPTWALALWRAVKFLFPPRMVEKIDLLSTRAGRQRDLHRRALRFLALEHLPRAYGGMGDDVVTEDGRRR